MQPVSGVEGDSETGHPFMHAKQFLEPESVPGDREVRNLYYY
jgi:hypothetical protein